jgi:D-glycero-D-manno-heptose 1,7-bisphosphate phosphatase
MNIIFLDRDGVINEYPGHGEYVTTVRQFKFIEGSKEAIALLTKHGYDIYVISSQAGVSKGLFTKETLEKITKKMLSGVKKAGGHIKKVMYCIHTKEDNCDCKKPNTGLFIQAVGELGEDFRNVYFIGDDKRDVETGRNLGCRTILVFSGKATKKELADWEFLPDKVALNLLEAVKKIVLPAKSGLLTEGL